MEITESNVGERHSYEPRSVVSVQSFEPDIELKNWWLNTRKNKIKYGNVEMPGFFSTYGYKSDALCFFLILLFELWGLYNFWILLEQIVYAVSLFFADVLLAIASHLWVKKLCFAKNYLVLAKNGIIYMNGKSPGDEIEIEKRKILNYKFYGSVFQILIFFLALFKIFSFLGNLNDAVNGLSITIIFSYLLVAFLHCYATGFFLSEVIRRMRRKAQYNFYLNSQNPLTEYTINNRREFDITINIKQNHDNLHAIADNLNYRKSVQKIVKLENAKTSNHILFENVLKTWGVLEDSELQNMIEAQKTTEQKECLAIYGLMHQMEILNSPIYRIYNGNREEINVETIPEIKNT